MLEHQPAAVLEPLNAVVRLGDQVVERVAIGVQDVDVAVAVHVDYLDARRAPIRMRRSVELADAEAALAVTEERDHRLVLLR